MSRPADWWVLDLDRDPVPGSPSAIRALARSWSGLADDAEYAETRVRQLMGDGAIGAWIGEAGDAFRDKTGELPEQLGKCKSSYRLASEALSWWADRLAVHQGDADAALVKGRAAHADLEHAKAQASAASAGLHAASGSSVLADAARYATSPPVDASLVPTPEQVSAARHRLAAAQAASAAADAAVTAAQSRLDHARALALDAAALRDGDARRTADRIHEAADAGIPERSRWDKLKDWAAEAWHVVITVAKVVVAVLGVIALIIGGPLAWVVFAAALLILADTIVKYMQGKASLWEVALAALMCIPGTKGLTSLAELSAAFKAGGALGALAHIGGAAKTAIVEMATAVRALGSGLRTSTVRILESSLLRLDAKYLPGGGATAERWMAVRAVIHRLRGGEFTKNGDLVVRRWTPADAPGPLGIGFPANTFRSSSYDEVMLRSETTLNRVIADGGNARGLFWTMDAPVGPLESQLNLALKPEWNTITVDGLTTTLPQATHYVTADFPAGTTVFRGPTEVQVSSGIGTPDRVSIPGSVLGGGEQIVPDLGLMKRWKNAAEEALAANPDEIPAIDVTMNLTSPRPVG